ncbi:MAG: hypothetical protein V3W41_13000 [Planctomycetota bacterium]
MIETGQVDVQAELDKGVSPAIMAMAGAETEAMREHMSPPGALNLPPLLEARRLEMGLPDDYFTIDAVFQRVFLKQLDPREFDEGRYGTTSLVVIPAVQSRENKEAPRGIIVSAGVDALDCLVSHGMELGHIVTFCEEAPYGIRVGIPGGYEQKVIVIDVGDIIASEDLAVARNAGDLSVVCDDEDDNKHKMVKRDGSSWTPIKAPKMSEGY